MNELDELDPVIESLADLALTAQSLHADPKPALPSLSKALADFSSLPSDVLFLGLANDGLPVVLDLHDPTPGPLLICGDPKSGKTSLLQMSARAVENLSETGDVQFGVITTKPAEWEEFVDSKHCIGIYPMHSAEAVEFLISLSKWTHSNRGETGFVLLLVDDLLSAARMTDGQQDLRWLLARGPSRHVWSMVTMDPSDSLKIFPWLDFFRSRIFGHMENPLEARALSGESNPNMDALRPSEFCIREGETWLKFWPLE